MKMKKLVIEPFAFDEGTRNEPTEFELFFRTTMAEYRYSPELKSRSLLEMWIFWIPKRKKPWKPL